MNQAYLIVREERHIDPKYWVCTTLEDAMTIARDVTAWWIGTYRLKKFTAPSREACWNRYDNSDNYTGEVDVYQPEPSASLPYLFMAEDCFTISVVPVLIRAPGETNLENSK